MYTAAKLTVITAALAAVTAVTAMNPAGAAERHVVEIVKLKFVPAQLEVAPGDTIVWINKDFVPHTITAADNSWDSGTMEKSSEWQTTVRSGMPSDYFCRFHPAMKARFNIMQ